MHSKRKDFRLFKLSSNGQLVMQNIIWQSSLIASYNLSSPIQPKVRLTASDGLASALNVQYALPRSAFPNQYVGFYLEARLRLVSSDWNLTLWNNLTSDQCLTITTETNIM